MSDVAFLTVAEAAQLLRAKKLSPVEYAKALIERIEQHDKKFNAFLRFTPDIALEDARRAEAEIMRAAWRGPFHGVPYGLKDIVDYTGLPTTGHSKILKDNIAVADAVVTQKLRAAGAVFMGKLSTHEFAVGGPSFDLPWPPARNPWNRDHFCGGSSSGSGAAVAAGFLPAAIGTDIRRVVPVPGSESTSTVPPTRLARSRMPTRPNPDDAAPGSNPRPSSATRTSISELDWRT